MIYRGFREAPLLAGAKELERLDMMPSEVCAILELSGAKWRAVQIREGRAEEFQDEGDGRVFQEATVAMMKATMAENIDLMRLGHATQSESFMLLAVSISLSRLFTFGPGSVRRWLRSGDAEARRVLLSFAIGSSILVEPQAIDILLHRIVKCRYAAALDSRKDISGPVIGIIERLGNSGNECLNPVVDAMK